MSWEDLLKNKKFRQTVEDIDAGEKFDRTRFRYRGKPDDVINRRKGVIETDRPVQLPLVELQYREHFSPVFALINRIIPKHQIWAQYDKTNKDKHMKWVDVLVDYQSQVKQMIKDKEREEDAN